MEDAWGASAEPESELPLPLPLTALVLEEVLSGGRAAVGGMSGSEGCVWAWAEAAEREEEREEEGSGTLE